MKHFPIPIQILAILTGVLIIYKRKSFAIYFVRYGRNFGRFGRSTVRQQIRVAIAVGGSFVALMVYDIISMLIE